MPFKIVWHFNYFVELIGKHSICSYNSKDFANKMHGDIYSIHALFISANNFIFIYLNKPLHSGSTTPLMCYFNDLCYILFHSLMPGWIFWEEPACSGITQCTLNNAILHLAAKYLEMDTTSCLRHFLILGTKVFLAFSLHILYVWCSSHLFTYLFSVALNCTMPWSSFLGKHVVWETSPDDNYVSWRVSRWKSCKALFSGMYYFIATYSAI